MGKKTNHLKSHHPERHSYDAGKRIPKAVMKQARKSHSGKGKHNSVVAKLWKKMHTRKGRQYSKNKIRKDIDGDE